ncbi:MAG TPA: FG-GAP-like repeat-containing protein [Bacteroidales bacterium]|nr:FG-GAP-like repeat-containing protein [Bacteroidales bacterium]
MRKLFLFTFPFLTLFFSNSGTAQIFTKVTDSPLVRDSCNSYYASWADYDNDGDIDLYLPMWFGSPANPFAKNYLYQNNCSGDFSKVLAMSGGLVTEPFAGAASNWIDYNNDGLLDLYVFQSRQNNINNSLYEKQKDGSFFKVNNSITAFNSSICVFADFNNDGVLDMYSGDTSLFVGNHAGGFNKIIPSPIYTDETHWCRNAIGTWADYDNDGDIDLLVITAINDGSMKNHLLMYKNNGQGAFQIDTLLAPYSDLTPAYGCAWGDYDNDLDLDLWINRNGGYDILLNNDGTGHFSQVTSGPVVNTSAVCQAGASWADYDNDGDLDLFVPTFYQNYLFDNNGDGSFTKNTTELFSNDAGYESYGACWADYNNDGDLDLFVNTGWANANDFLYQNNLYENNSLGHHWLKFECHGVTSNSDAVGTRIYAKANINGQDIWQMREINANTTRGGESGGASGHVVHMGFGDASVIDTLKVFWPASNTTQIFTNVPADQFLSIYENEGSLQNVAQCITSLPVKNPAIVSGKLYSDENNNCIFDEGDLPLANHFIKATPGAYFALTNENGDYELKVPEGNYNITFEPNRDEPWLFRTCNADSVVNLTTEAGTLTSAIDFPVFAGENNPCYKIDVQISSIGFDPDHCPPGQVLSTPCPTYHHIYCLNITNNGTSALPSSTNLEVWFDEQMTIEDILSNTCGSNYSLMEGIVLTHFNGAQINIEGLPVGGSCEICFNVFVFQGATPTYPVSAVLTTTPFGVSPVNLIFNGDFESGNTGFTSDYTYRPIGATTWGDYNVTSNPTTQNNSLWQTDHTTGNGRMLAADGDMSSSKYVWRTAPIAIQTNTNYVFSGFFNNTERTNINFVDPRIGAEINGSQIFTTGAISEIPDEWINQNAVWCSGSSTSAILRIRSLNQYQYGGVDYAIDDLSFFKASGYDYYEDQESCACDPNDKNVRPTGCGENGNIERGVPLRYTIRFENTGTGSAHNILLRDVLDHDFELSTFRILASSHSITSAEIIPDNTLIMHFDGIELPAVQYTPANKGFVVFEIQPKANLPEGTRIINQADIYFDQNEVVLTNQTLNTVRTLPKPDAQFDAARECLDLQSIDFNYAGLTPDSASFYWEFGPDATPSYSTEMDPQNIAFSDFGIKYITLTVNRFGCTSTVTDSIALTPYSCGNNKVLICHNGHTLCVSENAVPAHLAHGDCLGECNFSLRSSIQESVINDNYIFADILPNPADESTAITIVSGYDNVVVVELWNSVGKHIETIFNGFIASEDRQILNISTTDLLSGIYYIKVSTERNEIVKKLVVVH